MDDHQCGDDIFYDNFGNNEDVWTFNYYENINSNFIKGSFIYNPIQLKFNEEMMTNKNFVPSTKYDIGQSIQMMF